MQMVDRKRLSEGERVWLDRDSGEPINIDRAWAKSDRQIGLSRRTQALLAAAGQDEPARRWYVLKLAARAENDVDNALEKAGVERWLPVEEVTPKRRGGMKRKPRETVKLPFWPGYIFVKVANTDHAWAGLATVEGVLGVLGGVSHPAPLKDDIILKLKLFLQMDQAARDALIGVLKKGDRVTIDDGPFRSFEGTVATLCGFDRVKVEVSIFGQEVPVDLELAQITRID